MSGRRMSEQEYAERMSGLFEKVKAESPPGESELALFERYRDAEIDLTIEYRLGVDFPAARREALRAVVKRVQGEAELLKREFQAGRLAASEFAERMQATTDGLAQACASVLSPEEMNAYWGAEEGALQLPLLPGVLE